MGFGNMNILGAYFLLREVEAALLLDISRHLDTQAQEVTVDLAAPRPTRMCSPLAFRTGGAQNLSLAGMSGPGPRQ